MDALEAVAEHGSVELEAAEEGRPREDLVVEGGLLVESVEGGEVGELVVGVGVAGGSLHHGPSPAAAS